MSVRRAENVPAYQQVVQVCLLLKKLGITHLTVSGFVNSAGYSTILIRDDDSHEILYSATLDGETCNVQLNLKYKNELIGFAQSPATVAECGPGTAFDYRFVEPLLKAASWPIRRSGYTFKADNGIAMLLKARDGNVDFTTAPHHSKKFMYRVEII